MRILFTGASSFSGYWLVRELARAGHEITVTFQGQEAEYAGLRAERVRRVREIATPLFGVSFGSRGFFGAVRDMGALDLFCHHAAATAGYKSDAFDPVLALKRNTLRLPLVLRSLREAGTRRVLLTGSIFEGGEGAGSQGLPSFSPYGLSKRLTAEMFLFYTKAEGLHLGKFVVPNPFGPLEEPRFTDYLVRGWFAGKVSVVNTPRYVRDNIHVSLLAREYARFAESLPPDAGVSRRAPTGYAESQGAFAERFAREMSVRLRIPCALDLREQVDWSEPAVRVNTDVPNHRDLEWDETAAWNELADYYLARFRG